MCQALSFGGISVEPDDLQACRHIKKKDRVIIEFKCRKQKHRVISNRKTLQNKNFELKKNSGKLLIDESRSHENHQLTYKCRQVKNARKIHSAWFYKSPLQINLDENEVIHKIFHQTDIDKVWRGARQSQRINKQCSNLNKCLHTLILTS